MIIYIETFLIQNITINLCLLRLVSITTKHKTSFLKILLASIIGAIFSVFSVVVITNNYLLNVLKFICAVSMLKIAFKGTLKQFVFNLVLLFSFTYALGGAVVSLSSASYQTNFGMIISSKFSLEAISLCVLVLTYIAEKAFTHLKYKIKTNNYIYSIILEQEKNKIKINAYMDSGNLLNFNGNPITVLDINTYLKLTKTTLIDFYLNKNETIQTGTINGNGYLKIFKIDKITIQNKNKKIELKNQYIGVNQNNSFKETNYQALLSPLLL